MTLLCKRKCWGCSFGRMCVTKHAAFTCWWTCKSGQSTICSRRAALDKIVADEKLWQHVCNGGQTDSRIWEKGVRTQYRPSLLYYCWYWSRDNSLYILHFLFYLCGVCCASVFSQLASWLAIVLFHMSIHRMLAQLSLAFPSHNRISDCKYWTCLINTISNQAALIVFWADLGG